MWIQAFRKSSLSGELERRIASEFPDVRITWIDEVGQQLDDEGQPEVFFRNDVSRAALATVLRREASLRWMHTVSAGIDHILPLLRETRRTDLRLTKGRGVMSRPIAEYAIGQMIAALKGFPTYAQAQRRHEWLRRGVVARDVAGARLLILGLGSIGQATAQLASALGMRVWGVRHGAAEPVPGVERVLSSDDPWRDLLPDCDLLLIALPLTDATQGFIGAGELARLRRDAWLVNVARGPLIDETALVDALREQRLGGVVLDVTSVEPLPADHPLWDLPNVVLTPHISWRSPTISAAMLDLFLENLRRYQLGASLINEVVPDATY